MRHNDKADRRPLVPEISLTVLNTAGAPVTPDSPNFTPGPRFRAAVDGVRRAGGILIDPAIVAASVAEAVPTLKVPPTPEAAIDTLADAFAKIPAARTLLRTASAELARIEETVAQLREVRSLTMVPPWSLAIVSGWKPVENRTRNIAGSWRGRVLVLSSAGKWNQHAAQFIAAQTGTRVLERPECHPGHYIGAVDLVDVHRAHGGCCGPFGEPDVWHLQLANPVQFTTPIRATGHLGLRRITHPALIHAASTTIGA